LFLYIGYIALRGAIDDLSRADRASAVLALVGAVNVPIIHFSVEWWSSLHQGPTLIRAGGPAIEPAMMYPLLAMIFGFSLLFGALLLHRVRSEVLSRERRARWVRELLLPDRETA
jgi:heme exporter protein C